MKREKPDALWELSAESSFSVTAKVEECPAASDLIGVSTFSPWVTSPLDGQKVGFQARAYEADVE
ncbi:hypothetical protein ABZ372_28515 [Streptomyces sp. NPDC005921]